MRVLDTQIEFKGFFYRKRYDFPEPGQRELIIEVTPSAKTSKRSLWGEHGEPEVR